VSENLCASENGSAVPIEDVDASKFAKTCRRGFVHFSPGKLLTSSAFANSSRVSGP